MMDAIVPYRRGSTGAFQQIRLCSCRSKQGWLSTLLQLLVDVGGGVAVGMRRIKKCRVTKQLIDRQKLYF